MKLFKNKKSKIFILISIFILLVISLYTLKNSKIFNTKLSKDKEVSEDITKTQTSNNEEKSENDNYHIFSTNNNDLIPLLQYHNWIIKPYCFIDNLENTKIITSADMDECKNLLKNEEDKLDSIYEIKFLSEEDNNDIFRETEGYFWYYDNIREIGYSYSEDENKFMLIEINHVSVGSFASLKIYEIKISNDKIELILKDTKTANSQDTGDLSSPIQWTIN